MEPPEDDRERPRLRTFDADAFGRVKETAPFVDLTRGGRAVEGGLVTALDGGTATVVP
ncbi:hypothetical protein [Halorarum salinum]|uniref:Uncharacterized protein n=1 Tax=Halorarum salinum TaxID=2743089 RepID=A0A7D5QFY0_9EURY|nr:hypothetical protein [Halobaculum salinum]QLG61763.1 hypothetical protein HUG12_08485 [Halobaculum salinum]